MQQKKILIVYNSGAGSTKTIVNIFKYLLRKHHIDVMPTSTPFNYPIIDKYDLIILAFPCYHCNASPLMMEFINNMPLQPAKRKAFAFITYGLFSGNTLRSFINKCKKKNIYVEDYADYRAPATDGSLIFPPFKFMFRYEKNIAENIINDIQRIEKLLFTEKNKQKTPFFKLYTVLNYPNVLLGKNSKPPIRVRENVCSNCNLCVKSCPRGCWSIGNTSPSFDKTKCDTCYKCIHQCPQEALILSKRTISKKRLNPSFYKNLEIKIISEIRKIQSY